MNLLWKYIWMHKKGIFAFFLFTGIFLIVFELYDLPLAAVGYGAALSGFAGILLLLGDYLNYRKKYKKLQELKHQVILGLEGLPMTRDPLEILYQDTIMELFQEKQYSDNQQRKRYQELTEYYTTWAHQIKTPIAAMDLILQQQADTSWGPILSQELDRIQQYVEMVLVMLRLDADSTDYVLKSYSLDDIVKQAVRRFANSFIHKKLSLIYEPFDIKVLTDEKWLLFVMEQLLSNAVKYTREGSIKIFLEPPDTLCIQDTGMGIAPEDLPRIFEKGYTGYNGRAQKKASGLGLYLCHNICKKLGHEIRVESQVEQGTTVKVKLGRPELTVE